MVVHVTDYSSALPESVVDEVEVDPRSTWNAMRAEAKLKAEREKVEQKLAKERQSREAERQKQRAKKQKLAESQQHSASSRQQTQHNAHFKIEQGDDRRQKGKRSHSPSDNTDLIRPPEAAHKSNTRSQAKVQRFNSVEKPIRSRGSHTERIINMPHESAASINNVKVQQGFEELHSSLQWAAKNAIPCLDNMTKVIDSYYAENVALVNVPNRLEDPTTTTIDVITGDIVTVDNTAYDAAAWQQIKIQLDYAAVRMGADMGRLITRRRADEYIRRAKQMLMQAGNYEARVYTLQYPPYCALLSFMPIWTTCRYYGKGMSLYQSISSWTMEMLPGVIDVAISVTSLLLACVAFFFVSTPIAQESSIRGVKPPQQSSVPGCLRFFIQTFNFRDTREKFGVPMLTTEYVEEKPDTRDSEEVSEQVTFIAVRYCLKNYEWASAQQIYNLGARQGPMSDREALEYTQSKSATIEMSFTDKILIFPIIFIR